MRLGPEMRLFLVLELCALVLNHSSLSPLDAQPPQSQNPSTSAPVSPAMIALRGGSTDEEPAHLKHVGLLTPEGLKLRKVEEAVPVASDDEQKKFYDTMEDESALPQKQYGNQMSQKEQSSPSDLDKELWRQVQRADHLAVERMLRSGANPSAQDPEFGGWTAMHYAAYGGSSRIMATLLRFGGNLEALNERASTPLALAAAEGHISLVQKLVARGAKLEAENDLGIRPLHRAAAAGCTETCAKLLSMGAAVNATNILGVNALHMATAAGHIDTVERILEFGADVNSANKDGWTTLHYAAQNGDETMVETLLNHGAKCDQLSKLQMLPVNKAAIYGHNKTFERLYKASWAEDYGEVQLQVPVRDYEELKSEFEFIKSLPVKSVNPPVRRRTAAESSRRKKKDLISGRVFWKQKKSASFEQESEDEEISSEISGELEGREHPWPEQNETQIVQMWNDFQQLIMDLHTPKI